MTELQRQRWGLMERRGGGSSIDTSSCLEWATTFGVTKLQQWRPWRPFIINLGKLLHQNFFETWSWMFSFRFITLWAPHTLHCPEVHRWNNPLLVVPGSRLGTQRDQASVINAPRAWTGQPVDPRGAGSLNFKPLFKSQSTQLTLWNTTSQDFTQCFADFEMKVTSCNFTRKCST